MLDKSVTIAPATLADSEAVREFLRLNYILDSPMNKCLKVSPCVEIENWGVGMLSQGFSFKAVNIKNEIVGVLLNCYMTVEQPYFPDDWKSSSNDRYKILMTFFTDMDQSFNVFDEYPEYSSIFEVGMMSVNSEYRGAGIAMALLNRTMELVASLSIPLCVCVCSSRFSGIVCAKAGFEAVYRYPYKDYIVDGCRPVMPEEPHNEAVLYVRKM